MFAYAFTKIANRISPRLVSLLGIKTTPVSTPIDYSGISEYWKAPEWSEREPVTTRCRCGNLSMDGYDCEICEAQFAIDEAHAIGQCEVCYDNAAFGSYFCKAHSVFEYSVDPEMTLPDITDVEYSPIEYDVAETMRINREAQERTQRHLQLVRDNIDKMRLVSWTYDDDFIHISYITDGTHIYMPMGSDCRIVYDEVQLRTELRAAIFMCPTRNEYTTVAALLDYANAWLTQWKLEADTLLPF